MKNLSFLDTWVVTTVLENLKNLQVLEIENTKLIKDYDFFRKIDEFKSTRTFRKYVVNSYNK